MFTACSWWVYLWFWVLGFLVCVSGSLLCSMFEVTLIPQVLTACGYAKIIGCVVLQFFFTDPTLGLDIVFDTTHLLFVVFSHCTNTMSFFDTSVYSYLPLWHDFRVFLRILHHLDLCIWDWLPFCMVLTMFPKPLKHVIFRCFHCLWVLHPTTSRALIQWHVLYGCHRDP